MRGKGFNDPFEVEREYSYVSLGSDRQNDDGMPLVYIQSGLTYDDADRIIGGFLTADEVKDAIAALQGWLNVHADQIEGVA